MSEDDAKGFMNLMLIEMDKVNGARTLAKMDADLGDSLGYQILKKRLDVFKAKFNPGLDVGIAAQVFCAMVSENPAVAVMWAWTLNELWCRTGRQVTLDELTQHFPWGFPTKEAKRGVWEAQKVERKSGMLESDNAVDDFGTWSRK